MPVRAARGEEFFWLGKVPDSVNLGAVCHEGVLCQHAQDGHSAASVYSFNQSPPDWWYHTECIVPGWIRQNCPSSMYVHSNGQMREVHCDYLKQFAPNTISFRVQVAWGRACGQASMRWARLTWNYPALQLLNPVISYLSCDLSNPREALLSLQNGLLSGGCFALVLSVLNVANQRFGFRLRVVQLTAGVLSGVVQNLVGKLSGRVEKLLGPRVPAWGATIAAGILALGVPFVSFAAIDKRMWLKLCAWTYVFKMVEYFENRMQREIPRVGPNGFRRLPLPKVRPIEKPSIVKYIAKYTGIALGQASMKLILQRAVTLWARVPTLRPAV